jgi:hypothetical protein
VKTRERKEMFGTKRLKMVPVHIFPLPLASRSFMRRLVTGGDQGVGDRTFPLSSYPLPPGERKNIDHVLFEPTSVLPPQGGGRLRKAVFLLPGFKRSG